MRRNSKGFSLITVLSITVLATLWLTGTLASLLTVYRSTSTSKFAGEIESYADSVTALVLQSLNDSSQTSPYDNKINFEVPAPTWAPSGMKAFVSVVSKNPTSKSLLYDGTSVNNVLSGPAAPNQFGSNYSLLPSSYTSKIITTTVQFAGLTKVVQVIAGPPKLTTPTSNTPYGSPTGNNPFFSQAVLSTGSMQLGSNFTSYGHDFVAKSSVFATDGTHRLGGDITSYSPVSLSGTNLSIGGSLTAMSVNNFTTPPVTAQTVNPNSTTVNRYLNTSGTVSNFNDGSGNFPEGPINVLGLTNSSMQNQTQVIETQQDALAAQANNPVAPTPGAPTTASSASTIAPATKPLEAGDYSASALVVPGSTSLAVSGGSPVRVYLDPGGSGAQINGTVNAHGLPANFQIYYAGTGTIDLSGATINGTVYAPNANVIMSSTTVRGAIVAGSISAGVDSNGNLLPATNVKIIYDTSLANPSELKTANALGLLYDPAALKLALNGANGTGLYQLRYYAEQAKLH